MRLIRERREERRREALPCVYHGMRVCVCACVRVCCMLFRVVCGMMRVLCDAS